MDKYKELNLALDILEIIIAKIEKLNATFENKIDTSDYFDDIIDKVWDLIGEMSGADGDYRDAVYDTLFQFQNKDIDRKQFFDEFREIVSEMEREMRGLNESI